MSNESADYWKQKEIDTQFSIQTGQAINIAYDIVLRHSEGLTYEQIIDRANSLVPMIYRKIVAGKEAIRTQKTLFDNPLAQKV